MPQMGSLVAQLRSPGATKSAAHSFHAARLRATWSAGSGRASPWSAEAVMVLPGAGGRASVQQGGRLDADTRANEVGGGVVERGVLV
jgi:hypothetical protein